MERKPLTSLVGDLADPTELDDDLGGAAQPAPGTDPATEPGAAVTVTFTYRDVAYTIDLDPERADLFDRSVAPFIAAGRRVGGVRAEPARSRQPSENRAIRAWATTNGVPLHPRGRIPDAVREQFRAARENTRHQQT